MTSYWFTIPIALAFVVSAAMAQGGGGNGGPATGNGTTGPKPLTVGEVINIGNTLATIDQKPTGQLDPRGNPVMTTADFKFSGTTRLVFARIVGVSRQVLTDYQSAVAALEKQAKDDGGIAAERQKIFEAPAGVTLPHIKEADLCLEGPPKQPDCHGANEIPISALAVLVPIMDK